ncbi:MAG TPA: BON domain-containing protein [Gemmatimonadaceae bacterium]|nr:BON domain-containing protein [Gemmatimonadaceae bacterium]
MARDFEDVNDIDDLDDDELRGMVREHLAADSALDIDDLTINVEDGHVILDGRVGTDEERRIAEHIVTDVLGVEDYENNIFVDPVRRATSPEAADDNLADEDATEGRLLGDRPVSLSPEVEDRLEDEDAQLYGTTDLSHAMEEGTSLIPPEAPTPEGFPGQDERGELGEDH